MSVSEVKSRGPMDQAVSREGRGRAVLQWVHLLTPGGTAAHLWPLTPRMPHLNIHSTSTYVEPAASTSQELCGQGAAPRAWAAPPGGTLWYLGDGKASYWKEHRATQYRAGDGRELTKFWPWTLRSWEWGRGVSQASWFVSLQRSGLLLVPCFPHDTPHFYGGPLLSLLKWPAAVTPGPRADLGLLCAQTKRPPSWSICIELLPWSWPFFRPACFGAPAPQLHDSQPSIPMVA